ncbi:vacuolar protein sorting-associated protein 35 [Melanogaster broomeanus]|nr:vacuolar protein sorting-associated protein 35 [Melanogaster broomeanus]
MAATTTTVTTTVVEEGKLLSESLATVKIQVGQMKRHLDNDDIMDALKCASLMLAELRTSSLSPKQYYELYMAVFDALRHLSNYLYDAHTQSRHHLADLYELVQYAGNILPRLYLMITVGSVYMSIPDAPVKEIMKDMMEMSRGVLNPIRGLFLRHYLSGQTRDHLPVGVESGPQGNLQDSISFVLTNFIEMNKLWVRLQHQGHSRDREKREMERRDLRILVGTNLVRLSQLDGVDLEMYQKDILPAILEQVVNCKDAIAQEYLMEAVIQVFTDEFHLHTLGPFLSATAQLHPKVNIKLIVIGLIDRLAAYAAREAESEDPEETKRQEEAAAKRLAEKVRLARKRANHTDQVPEEKVDGEDAWGSAVAEAEKSMGAMTVGVEKMNGVSSEEEKSKEGETEGSPVRKFRGVPENVQLFEVFWKQVVELIKARPDLSIQDITALLVSLTNLSLSCYPDRLEYVDQILGFAHDKIKEFADSPDLHAPQTATNLAALLVAPINSYQSVLTLLAIPRYQLFSTRRSIAHSVVSSVLKNETIIENPGDVDGVLDLCHVLIKDQVDAAAGTGMKEVKEVRRQGPYFLEREDLAEEQGWVARMVHLFRADSLDVQFELLQMARKHFEAGGERMRYTFPALITASIKLCRRYKNREHLEEEWQSKVTTILKFVRECTSILATQVDSPSECGSGFEDLAYDFYVQSFSVYEDSISESRAQLAAITLIIGTLQGARVFEVDGYDTLITKAALHGAKLLKKPHQALAVHAASHLWWQEPIVEEGEGEGEGEAERGKGKESEKEKEEGEGTPAYPHQDGKRVLECLQKSLRIANSATEEIVTVQLYCDTLDQYLYYFDRKAPAIAPKFIVSLVELITSSIDTITSPASSSSYLHPSQRIEGVASPDMIQRHFRNTLQYIYSKKTSEAPGRYDEVEVVGAFLKMGITR